MQNKVQAIKAFNDNYIWCITSDASNHCTLVDPGDAQVCIDFLNKNNLLLTNILITHHHSDHVGGVKTLIDFAAQQGNVLCVYGPANENIQQLDIKLVEGEHVNLFDNQLSFTVIDLPGHTSGHIAYYSDGMLFCGDTLFSGGCGRLFEGTPVQMHNSLSKLAKLPEHTKVYCAHEYTLANLEFARTIEPNNSQLNKYYENALSLRANGDATIPSSIGLEKQINPFLRTHINTIKLHAERESQQLLKSNPEIFAIIRQLKDNF
ncbi:hydroxyacylglutathione hydrolase [Colwelliaceae bacterium BS250]